MNKYNKNFDAHIADVLATESPRDKGKLEEVLSQRSYLTEPMTEEQVKAFWGDDYIPLKNE